MTLGLLDVRDYFRLVLVLHSSTRLAKTSFQQQGEAKFLNPAVNTPPPSPCALFLALIFMPLWLAAEQRKKKAIWKYSIICAVRCDRWGFSRMGSVDFFHTTMVISTPVLLILTDLQKNTHFYKSMIIKFHSRANLCSILTLSIVQWRTHIVRFSSIHRAVFNNLML